ncbi:hypothetical protein M670_03825 [Schinkia azotoformans MEV2011]|uniref:MADF domain-containing protein n=1 Tax=Schinkia azotoformans MEV2011 TaxID=1348973 RepID=A0A072NH96_SCHAZ|nr:hypothetical protein [Schinkia azotoformans]KEF36911.1 hypothetical protein M670_03825 [Schinkia azotoformans MEV2011]MEC1697091.1 hypothetical protein [Schinkia azotoformans]MEC1726354.1 hypothetical protein [Schinkia azotoformans]MEC1773417.1 hypothetical protein [Schinkia azotoformans]MEC1779905.1 hypothetical protein [Schinkia azotoformans]
MNKYDDQLERLIHQSIQEDFKNVPELNNRKEETWNKISKYIFKSRKNKIPYKPLVLVMLLKQRKLK